MTTNYQENGQDIDLMYAQIDNVNYFSSKDLNIEQRKIVLVGQNVIANSYRICNFGQPFYVSSICSPKIDKDSATLVAVLPSATIFMSDGIKIRGAFTQLENYRQVESWRIDVKNSVASPIQIGTSNDWLKVTCNATNTFAIKTDGTLWGCGNNTYGQLGINDSVSRYSLVQIGSISSWQDVVHSSGSTRAIKTDGTLWTWGYNNIGQLGLSDLANRYSPVQVGTLSDWSQVSSYYNLVMAIKTNGTLWGWGSSVYGGLGLGDITTRYSPVQVGGLSNWAKVECGTYHTVSIKTDGTLWAWGNNSFGQLGLSNTTHRYSPVQVGALSDWSKISVSGNFAFAIKTNGTLWAWGNNFSGQLGLSDTTDRYSPVQVGTLSDWSQIYSSVDYAIAIKTDGTLWGSGLNGSTYQSIYGFGQLGLGDQTNRYSFVQIGSSNDWSENFKLGSTSTVAIKTNGTLWTWGYNDGGRMSITDDPFKSQKLKYGI